MVERDISQEILDGIREIKAHKAGKGNLRTHQLKDPASPQVIRQRLKLSQAAFAGLMGVCSRTVPSLFNDLLILLAILILLIEIYRKLCQPGYDTSFGVRKKPKGLENQLRCGRSSERDCRFCQEDKPKWRLRSVKSQPPGRALRKGKGGRRRKYPQVVTSVQTRRVEKILLFDRPRSYIG